MNDSSNINPPSPCGGALPRETGKPEGGVKTIDGRGGMDLWNHLTREELIRELRLLSLRRQVTPHFLFNSISVAISLTLRNPKTAVAFLRHLASMYRYLLTYGNEYAVPVEQELEMMRQYYELISLRYVGSIHLTIAPEAKRLRKHPLPPLALQGLLENAIKHNAHSKEQPLEVRLTVTDDLCLCISNNIVPMVSPTQGTHKGLAYINETLRLLYGREMAIHNDGTTYSVLLPLI